MYASSEASCCPVDGNAARRCWRYSIGCIASRKPVLAAHVHSAGGRCSSDDPARAREDILARDTLYQLYHPITPSDDDVFSPLEPAFRPPSCIVLRTRTCIQVEDASGDDVGGEGQLNTKPRRAPSAEFLNHTRRSRLRKTNTSLLLLLRPLDRLDRPFSARRPMRLRRRTTTLDQPQPHHPRRPRPTAA